MKKIQFIHLNQQAVPEHLEEKKKRYIVTTNKSLNNYPCYTICIASSLSSKLCHWEYYIFLPVYFCLKECYSKVSCPSSHPDTSNFPDTYSHLFLPVKRVSYTQRCDFKKLYKTLLFFPQKYSRSIYTWT